MNRTLFATVVALTLAGCGADPASDSETGVPNGALPRAARTPLPTPPPPARISRTTSLSDCHVIESKPDEAGYRLSDCPGMGDYALRRSEADGRETLLVRQPGGVFQSLDLSAGTNGGFSRLGETAEWRGRTTDGVFRPDILVVRHVVSDDPGDPKKETSSLVTILLTSKYPCVLARIVPGPDQSARARAVADSNPTCAH